jgi:hypothetical protein
MASTAIPTVKAIVLGALEADPTPEGLEEVTVSGGKEPTRATEYLWIYKAKAVDREFKIIGPKPAKIDERILLFLRVLVVKGEVAEAEARALAIGGVVEGILRELDTEDDEVQFFSPFLVSEIEDEQLQFDQKAGCHVLMTASIKTRI